MKYDINRRRKSLLVVHTATLLLCLSGARVFGDVPSAVATKARTTTTRRPPADLAGRRIVCMPSRLTTWLTYLNRGNDYLTQGKLVQAIGQYNLSISGNRNNPWAFVSRGHAHYRIAMSTAPTNPRIAADHLRNAIRDYDQALALRPDNQEYTDARAKTECELYLLEIERLNTSD
jgi:hypothetical protein